MNQQMNNTEKTSDQLIHLSMVNALISQSTDLQEFQDNLSEYMKSNNDLTISLENQLIKKTEQLLEYKVQLIKTEYKNLFKKFSPEVIAQFYKSYYAISTDQQEFVYFMHNKENNLIKIGHTTDIYSRLSSINSEWKNLYGTENAITLLGVILIPSGKGREAEYMYHERAKEYRRHGEWFELTYNQVVTMFFPSFEHYNGILVKFDTHKDLINEGFPIEIKWKKASEEQYYYFALKTLNYKDCKVKNCIEQYALYFLRRKFNIPTPIHEAMIVSDNSNITWDMYQWLYLHRKQYGFQSNIYYNFNTQTAFRYTLKLERNVELIDEKRLQIDKAVSHLRLSDKIPPEKYYPDFHKSYSNYLIKQMIRKNGYLA